jgi:hypothetical protein
MMNQQDIIPVLQLIAKFLAELEILTFLRHRR